MYDLLPLGGEADLAPIHVVVRVVALDAQVDFDALGVAFPGIQSGAEGGIVRIPDVQARRAMAALAADIFQIWRVLLVAETALIGKAHGMADDALGVILAIGRVFGLLHQRLVSVRVGRVFPDLVGFFVTLLAALGSDVRGLLIRRRAHLKWMLRRQVLCQIVLAL